MEIDPLNIDCRNIPPLILLTPSFECSEVTQIPEHKINIENEKITGNPQLKCINCSGKCQCTQKEELKKPYECTICKNIFNDEDSLLTHLKLHTKDLIMPNETENTNLQCLVCKNLFENISLLHVHMSIKHKGLKPYRCRYCAKNYTQLDTLDVHQQLEHIGKPLPYCCTICKEEFKTATQLTGHMDSIHHKTYKCALCVKCFGHPTELKKHERTHSMERQFACDRCDETFSLQSSLTLHKNRVHDTNADDKPFQCYLCDYSFSQASDLNIHIYVHINEKPFECPDCAELFENLKMFQDHMRTHEDKPNLQMSVTNIKEKEADIYDDDYFQSDFEASSPSANLDVNSEIIGNSELAKLGVKISYNCPVCKKQFTDITEFNNHSKLHETISDAPEMAKNTNNVFAPTHMKKIEKPKRTRKPVSLAWQERDNKVRNFSCKQCNRSFTLASTLTLHFRRTHLGIKPYECKVCGWTFAQSGDRIKHMRKHTGERPYKCVSCGLGFTQNRNLKNHMKMHTEAPSKCKYCNKEFLIDTSLIQHLKKHEGPSAVECEFCKIPYSCASDLTKHVKRFHSDGKPHICEHCKKAFIKLSDMKKHMRIHTGKQIIFC